MVLFFEKNHSPALLSFGGNCALSSSKLILSTIIQYSILKNLWQRYTFILIFARKSKKKVIDEGFFYLTSPLLLGDFRKSSPVPFFTLKEGAPPLPRPPLLRRGLQPLHAVPLITPYGLQGTGAFISPRPISYATELRLSKRRGRPCGIGCMRMPLVIF